jgi:hypothetical protein
MATKPNIPTTPANPPAGPPAAPPAAPPAGPPATPPGKPDPNARSRRPIKEKKAVPGAKLSEVAAASRGRFTAQRLEELVNSEIIATREHGQDMLRRMRCRV